MRRRFRSLPALMKATVIGAVMIVLFGTTLAVGIVALSNSHDAAARATATANCVNNVLGERAKINDTPALIEEAKAEAAWGRAIVAAISVPKNATPVQHKAATTAFIAAINNYASALAHVYITLAMHQHERALHPLGKC